MKYDQSSEGLIHGCGLWGTKGTCTLELVSWGVLYPQNFDMVDIICIKFQKVLLDKHKKRQFFLGLHTSIFGKNCTSPPRNSWSDGLYLITVETKNYKYDNEFN